jgi:hypothetical protein
LVSPPAEAGKLKTFSYHLSFQIPWCASLHRINAQVISDLLLWLSVFFQLLTEYSGGAMAQQECLNKCYKTFCVKGLAVHSHFHSKFQLDCFSHLALEFVYRMFKVFVSEYICMCIMCTRHI